MPRRPIVKLRPGFERLDGKLLLSAGPSQAHVVSLKAGAGTSALHAAGSSGDLGGKSEISGGNVGLARGSASHHRLPPKPTAFLGFRITNPTIHKVKLFPPFDQVLVQSTQPVPGQVYNVLSIAVKNGTLQTFTASNGFTVRVPGGPLHPVLTGDQEWLPGKWIVFYILTKKYYPLAQVPGGFQFNLGGRITTLVPGPSAIFLRLKYNPATFARTLNWITAFGQGAQLGLGPPVGMPDTAINQIVAGRAHKIDFGGHF